MAPFPPDRPAVIITGRQSTQTFVAIPSTYGSQHSSPSPGAVAGIVLGSVAAFALVLYLIYALLHGSPVLFRKTSSDSSLKSHSVVSFRTRTRSHRGGRKRNSRVSETTEIRSQERVSPAEPTIVDPPRTVSPLTEESVDEVVVIEEHTPPPSSSRRDSRRYSGYRRDRDSGYRDGDPGMFVGGEEPVREARREVRYSRGSRG